MLWLAVSTSFISWLIISVILLVASFVSSDNWRISSATTANPLPASPALAASIEALSARRFVWLDIDIMLPTISSTSLTFSERRFVALTVLLLFSSTVCAWRLRSSTTLAPSSIVVLVISESSFISRAFPSALEAASLISLHICACFWIASAVLSVLPDIFFIDTSLELTELLNTETISDASSNLLLSCFATSDIISFAFCCFCAPSFIASVFSLKKSSKRLTIRIVANAESSITTAPITIVLLSASPAEENLIHCIIYATIITKLLIYISLLLR